MHASTTADRGGGGGGGSWRLPPDETLQVGGDSKNDVSDAEEWQINSDPLGNSLTSASPVNYSSYLDHRGRRRSSGEGLGKGIKCDSVYSRDSFAGVTFAKE